MADNIKAPSHYVDGREYEPKDVIRDWGLNFNLGSAVKYISRAGRKGDILEDLQKAKQFLEFEIAAVEEEEKSDIGMTCKEAAAIGDAIAKGFEEGLKEADDIEAEEEERGKMKFDINKIAQEVLDSARDIENDISSDELREAVIDLIVERIVNGELSSSDIPWRLFEYSRRIRNAVNVKYRDDPPFTVRDTITIAFNFEKED